MDMDNVDPRIFIRNYDCDPGRRISLKNCDIITDPRISQRYSTNPRISRNISHNEQISISTPGNEETPTKLTRLENVEEIVPLQRKKLDAKFKEINPKKHSCTDVHCLLIFIAFIVAWVYISCYAFSQGDLKNVLMPTDSKNAKCGLDSGVRDKKMLFLFNLDKCLDPMTPITGCKTKQICVKSCPQKNFSWQEYKKKRAANFYSLKENLVCDSILDKRSLKNMADVEKAIEDDNCSGWYLKSKPIFNHCVWDFSENVCNMLPKMLTGRQRRSDIYTKFTDFIDHMKSLCAQQNYSSTSFSNNVVLKGKLEQSNSILNQIIAGVVSKFNYNGREILSEHIVGDLKISWKVLILSIVIHLFVVLIFITLLRWLAAPLVWLSIVGVIIGLALSFAYSWNQYRFWSKQDHVPHHAPNLLAQLQNLLERGDFWLYVTIALGILLTVIVLIIVVIRKRIKIAVAIIKESSRAITNIKSTIFFPIFPGILYIIVVTLSIIIMLYLSSIGEFSFKMIRSSNNFDEKCVCTGPTHKPYNLGDTCDPALFEQFCHIENDSSKSCSHTSCSFDEIVKSSKTQWFMLFNIFAFVWVTFFISAYEDMVLACTFSIWYWTFNKKDIIRLPLLKAIWITTFYHLGTLAFGSLILSICRVIRYILEFIEKKAKMYDNAITRAIICCMQCFFWILEKFLRFLNKNAYITCAIHSTNFCDSSKKAFSLITQNILRVYGIDKVSDFLFLLSKILVTGFTSCLTYIFLKTYPTIIPIHYPIVPVGLVAIITYIMAYFIFSTYSMAVDTLFFCFLEDSVENDGSSEKPFYMSKELKKLVGKSKNKRKQLRK